MTVELARESVIDKTVAYERAVLGGILVDPSRWDDAMDVLHESDWFRVAHRLIWRAMAKLAGAGHPIDSLTLIGNLSASELADIGGASYLFALTDGVPKSMNVAHYARQVSDAALSRRTAAAARAILADAESGDTTALETLQRADALLAGLRSDRKGSLVLGPSERSGAVFQQIEAAGQAKPKGVLTRIHGIDSMTMGFRPGQLVVLGARPSQGKSALALTIALAAGITGPVLFCSLEMSVEEINLREVSSRSGVAHALVDAGGCNDAQLARLSTAATAMEHGHVHVLDQAGATLSQIRGAARRIAVTQPLSLIVVDYIQLMRPERGEKTENRTIQVSQFSSGLKLLARELSVPVLALSQLSRESERRENKTPQLSDLRDSGALEQDADIVMLLWRPNIGNANADTMAELNIAKQRNGPIGTVKIHFDAATMRYGDL